MPQILISEGARRSLRRVDRSTRRAIDEKIGTLANWPDVSAHPMWGAGRGHYRMKAGNYRIIFHVDQESGAVLVDAIGHRGDVYSRFH